LFLKNKFASFLDSQISKNNNVSIVPYAADRTVSTIEFTYQNQQVKIKYPDPDYYIDLDIKNLESFEWVYFKNSLNALFNKISVQTNKLDSKWIKNASESKRNVKKDFKELKNVYNKCR